MSSDNSALIADALLKTNPELASDVGAASSFRTSLSELGARTNLYRSYERGEHRAQITDQMKKMLRIDTDTSGLNDLNDNYCSIVIDKMVGRLHVNQISVSEGRWVGFLDKILAEVGKLSNTIAKAMRSLLQQVAEKLDSLVIDEWVAQTLERNDWEALQDTIFRSTARDGQCFVMVDPVTLKWSVEPAYDGFSGVVAIFDSNTKTPIWACKLWAETSQESGVDMQLSTMKLVVYERSRITYWKGLEGTSIVEPDNVAAHEVVNEEGQFDIAIDNIEFWPLQTGKPPIVHFINKYDPSQPEGESELRSAIPLQDILNRTVHSMVMASEFSAFSVRWAIGLEIEAAAITPGAIINLVLRDKNGNIITELTEENARFMQAVKVGQFEPTDISQYISQCEMLVREISQNTQTPIYGITVAGALSGEAMKQLEIGLIGKVERFQRQNSDSVRELIQLTAEIQNAFINDLGNAPVFSSVSLTWKPAELLDVAGQVTVLLDMRNKAPGLWPEDFYRDRIGGLLGMSTNDIAKQSEAAKQEQQNQIESLTGGGGDTLPVV